MPDLFEKRPGGGGVTATATGPSARVAGWSMTARIWTLPKRWRSMPRGELLPVNGWRRANANALTPSRNTPRAEAGAGVAVKVAGRGFACARGKRGL